MPTEYAPELVTVDLRHVVQGNKANYLKFLARTKHAPVMVRNSMMLAYEEALADVNKLLDAAKVKNEP
jgi:hypothetical protein